MKPTSLPDIPSDLMAHPGDLVNIKPDGDQAWRIELKAGHSIRRRRICTLVAVVLIVLAIFGTAGINAPINPDVPRNLWTELGWPSLGILALIVFFIVVAKGRILGTQTLSLRISPDTVRIWEGNVVAIIPWKDIHSTRLLHRDPPRKTLHPSAGRPWMMSSSDGLVLETPHGALRILSRWHDDVTGWMAGLIAERAHAPLQNTSTSLPLVPNPYDLTSFNTRSFGIWLGGFAVVFGIIFAASMWTNHRDAQQAESWRQVAGQIQNVESAGSKKNNTRVTYRYVVNKKTYINDRYDFGFQLSSRYLDFLRRFALEDGAVTVWHDPADPQRSVLKRRGGRIAHTLFWVSAVAVPIGLYALLRGLLMQTLPLRKHYQRSLLDESD